MSLPYKAKKIQQENFRTYADLRSWMHSNRFSNKGYVLEEPYRSLFIERWEKEGLIALSMNVMNFTKWDTLPSQILDKPYQVDIAEA